MLTNFVGLSANRDPYFPSKIQSMQWVVCVTKLENTKGTRFVTAVLSK